MELTNFLPADSNKVASMSCDYTDGKWDIVQNYSCLIDAVFVCMHCTCPTCMLAEKLCRGLCAFEAEPSRRASTSCLASLTPPMASHSPPGIVRGLLQQLRQPRQAVYLHTCVPAATMLRLYPRAGRHAFGQHVRPLPVWCNANVAAGLGPAVRTARSPITLLSSHRRISRYATFIMWKIFSIPYIRWES